MAINISQIPDSVWTTVKFSLLGDRGERIPKSFDIEVLLKSEDELIELKKEIVEELRKEIQERFEFEQLERKKKEKAQQKGEVYEEKSAPEPSAVDSADLRFCRKLIVDWSGVQVEGAETGKPIELPYTLQNFRRLLAIREIPKPLINKVAAICRREEEEEKNLESLGGNSPIHPSKYKLAESTKRLQSKSKKLKNAANRIQ